MRASRPAADDRNRSSKLGNSLNADLARIAAEDLSPWVKLGHVIFRAEEITYTRQRAEVRAAVRVSMAMRKSPVVARCRSSLVAR